MARKAAGAVAQQHMHRAGRDEPPEPAAVETVRGGHHPVGRHQEPGAARQARRLDPNQRAPGAGGHVHALAGVVGAQAGECGGIGVDGAAQGQKGE